MHALRDLNASNKVASTNQRRYKMQTSKLRNTRIAKRNELLLSKHVATKQAKYQQVTSIAAKQAYKLAVQQLQAQYGVTAGTPRTGSTPKSGVTAQVWSLAAEHQYNRKATLAACAAVGINPATAATQYALAKRASAQ